MTGPTAVDRKALTGEVARWRWTALVVALSITGLLDLLLAAEGGGPSWTLLHLPLMLTVTATALRGLRRSGHHLFRSAATAAVLSLVLSISLYALGAASGISFGFGSTEGTALTLVLVACWRRASGRRQYVVTGAVALAVVILPLRLGLTGETTIIEALAITVAALAAATGSALRATDTSHDTAITLVRRAEREDVARELHDVVAHHVTGMVVLTQAARTVAGRPWGSSAVGTPPAASAAGLDKALAAVERAGVEALVSLRSMVSVLRSVDPTGPSTVPVWPTPTVADLDDVVRRFRESGASVRVDLTIDPEAQDLPPQVQAAMHRVVQESLTNVSRYARGSQRVCVDLTCADDLAVVAVTDSGGGHDDGATGAGDDVEWGGGFGIVGMRERVTALGGRLSAGPNAETTDDVRRSGWTVRAEVPR